jgi:hypothetical protein
MKKSRLEASRPSKAQFSLENEYARKFDALNQAGILTRLPRSKTPGVIGIDGIKYPMPEQEQVKEVFARNKELADRKIRQGFTQLQLTPVALPIPELVDLVESAVIRHAEAGKIIQTKQKPKDADVPARVADKPRWIWEALRQALDTDLIYFPQTYTERDHKGFTKEEVIRERRFCAVPGWSVGLIEPTPVMPQQGQAKTKAGRKQLEGNSNPREYLQTLSAQAYQGETGWTLEDFLTHFATQLETTNQVSHARYDSNSLWLLGQYLPNPGRKGMTNLVPVGYWDRGRMYLSLHRSGNRFKICVARSMVRLGREPGDK